MSHRIVIGIHSTREALKVRPNKIETLYLREKWRDSEELRKLGDMAGKAKISIEQVAPSFLEKFGKSHQGVGAKVAESPILDWNRLKNKKQSLLVVLDQVEDPQNLGAILRTSWLMAVDAFIITKDRTSPLTPTVSKVASGALEHIPVEAVTSLSSWLKDRREDGYWIYGFDASGKQTFWQVDYPEKVILVLGAEGHGLRKSTISSCDEILKIPQSVQDASFNVSASSAMAIAEVRRQQTST